MAIPLIVGGAIAGIGAISKGIKARKQRKLAEKIDDTRPVYKRPAEIDKNVQMYRNLSQAGMPGQGAMEARLGEQTAGALGQVERGGGSAVNRLQALTQLTRGQQQSQQELGIQSAQYKSSIYDKLAQAREMRAQYKDVEFDYNKNQEFQYRRRQKNMLLQAADQNAMGMWSDIGGIGTSVMSFGAAGGLGGGGRNTGGAGRAGAMAGGMF